MNNRSNVLLALQNPLDILIIGGGIVGAGLARDAAMRGLRVGLVEQNDFASGTSSRSSRLLHGGIRYLAQGRIGLVHEASVEKTIIRKIAPHLADPLAFVFPTYEGSGWPLWQLRIGVRFYDLLCGGRNLGSSKGLDINKTLTLLPGLETDGLKGAVRYYDGLTNDARLVLDTLQSATHSGALVANYTKFVKAEYGNGCWLGELEDCLAQKTLMVRAEHIINATGPWADGLAHSSVKLRLTKGIHLVLDRSRLPFDDAVVITEEKRILFVIPWGDRVIVGTTDTDYAGPPEDVRSTGDDIEYVLTTVNQFFPFAQLTSFDVISSWAGLRPLLADSNGNPSDISRSHEIRNPKAGWWDVAGGKLTTYRLMAEQTIDRILKKSGRQHIPSSTSQEPLLPFGKANGHSGIVPPPFTKEIVESLCHDEWSIHLDDVMIRRTSWQHYHRDADRLACQVAIWMAECLGWNEATLDEELERYRSHCDWPPKYSPASAAHFLKP